MVTHGVSDVVPRHLCRHRPGGAGRDARGRLHRARHAAGSRRAQARTPVGGGGGDRRLGHADLRLRAVAAGHDLGLRGRAGQAGRAAAAGGTATSGAGGDGAMIVVLLNTYIAILALFVWLKFIPLNLFWKISPVIVLLVLLIGLFIPMQWGAPSGPGVIVRNSVQIVPSVAGEVVDVPVEANTPVKQGDVLFRIDPTTYDASVRALQAQLKLQEQRLAEMTQLQTRGTGRAFDVEQRQAQVDGAQWSLDKTIVRAPADGYVTNLALRKGARVTAQSPVMAFIDTADTIFGAEIAQPFARYIEPGQAAEATFKMFPGQVFTGRVETVIQAVATGQAQVSGSAVAPAEVQTAPFVVRIRLDDETIAERLPAGSTASVAIFTDRVKASHVIRKVLLRQTALVNYVIP